MPWRLAFLALGLSLVVSAPAAAQNDPFANCLATDAIRSGGMSFVPIPGRPDAFRVTRTGAVHIPCRDTALWADEVIWETDTRLILARGAVIFQQADLHIFADRAEINGDTKFGTFFNAVGRARLGDAPQEKNLFGTLEPDVLFHAERIERAGPGSYRITNGSFTTCKQAVPRWEMSGTNGTITLDKYVLLRNVVLRVKRVPLLYLPAIYYPINKEDRATGFLLPSYGSSSFLGSSISNAFFWAINRSQDATIYHDFYTRGGHGVGTEYRYASAPGSEGRATFYVINRPETGNLAAGRSYRLDANASQGLPRGFRLVGDANLFTDAATQQLHQDVNVASRREQFIKGTLTGSLGRARLLGTVEQRDFFFGTSAAQRTGRAPYGSVTLADTPIRRSAVYAGFWAEGGRVIRRDNVDDPATDRTLWRFDTSPSVRVPLSRLPFLSARTSASFRFTQWSESRDPVTSEQVPVLLTRQLFEVRGQVGGPNLSRVFLTPGNRYAERFKHVIEPSVDIAWKSPFDRLSRVVANEPYIDSVVGGTTTINYQLRNALLARLTGSGHIREILTVNVGQSYYTNALAARVDPAYQSSGATKFSPIRIDASTRPVDRASASFRMEIDPRIFAIQGMSASGSLDGTYARVNGGWSRNSTILILPGSGTSIVTSHFLTATTTIKTRDNRAGGSYSVNYDLLQRAFRQQRVMTYYNSQCCGIAFDWQSIGVPLLGIPVDRRWGVSFTLAGIGSFSNSLGSFGGR